MPSVSGSCDRANWFGRLGFALIQEGSQLCYGEEVHGRWRWAPVESGVVCRRGFDATVEVQSEKLRVSKRVGIL